MRPDLVLPLVGCDDIRFRAAPDEADRGWIDDFVAATYAREIRNSAPV